MAPAQRLRSAWSCRAWILVVTLVGGLTFAMSASAQVVFNVDSTSDEVDVDTTDGVCLTAANTCTLRAAVMQANRMPNAGATIMLPAGTYTLTRPPSGTDGEDNGDLNLISPAGYAPGPTTIVGAGADVTIIDANGIDRVLSVDFLRTVSISDVTLRNGFTNNGNGGGILNGGSLTVSHCVIGPNTTGFDGGGIASGQFASLTLSDSTLTGSHATNGGGLLTKLFAATSIVRSTISSNTASNDGGGIYAEDQLTIVNSTISLNRSNRNGGGINFSQDAANVYNSTIAFNQAATYDASGGTGGGIYFGSTGSFNIRNTVVAGNTLSSALIYNDCTGSIGIYGSNRIWNNDGCFVYPGSPGSASFLTSLAELGQLQNNGGPTETIALVPPSDMIDGADAVLGCIDPNSVPLATDQRGYPRVAGISCDIGAFEYQDIIFANGFE